MNEALIEAWNSTVRSNDDVYHLGDITMEIDPSEFLARLSGRIHVIRGNHDSERLLKRAYEAKLIRWYGDTRVVRWNGSRLFLSHYPHRFWPKMEKGYIHLYGHMHNTVPGHHRSMDVGVDAIGPYPISIEEVVSRMETVPFAPRYA